MTLGVMAGCGTATPAPSPEPGANAAGASSTAPCPGRSTPAPTTSGSTQPTSAPSSASPSSASPSSTVNPAVPPTTSLPARLLGVDWTVLPTERRVVALTFDCGASNAAVAPILGALAEARVRATFFVTGAFARAYPADVARIVAAGHLVANHSDTHAHYPDLTDAQIAADLASAQASILAAGATSSVWFRFPYGDRTDADVRAVNTAGWVPIRWTVDTLGWQGTTEGGTAAEVTQRVLDAARPGEIVLMHVGANPEDGSTLDADALPDVIERLRATGYGFTTIDLLLQG